MTFGGGIGSINIPAAGSGGPIMDLETTSEADGRTAGGTVDVDGTAEEAGVGPGSALEATIGGFSIFNAVPAGTADATGAEAGFGALAPASVDCTGAGAGGAEVVAVGAGEVAAGAGWAAAAFAETGLAETVLDEVAFWAAAL